MAAGYACCARRAIAAPTTRRVIDGFEIRPATPARFDDVTAMIGRERAGCELAARIDAVSGGVPRVVMRKQLGAH